jgi:hypothetical protein
MLFLLRNIRRKLMKENKITTYLLYAIGEIFLVVVGILIAVSIDDWNEDRIVKRELDSYYLHINNELTTIVREIDVGIARQQHVAFLNKKSLDILSSKNKDSLHVLQKTLGGLGTAWAEEFIMTKIDEFIEQGYLAKTQDEELIQLFRDFKNHINNLDKMSGYIQNQYITHIEPFFREKINYSEVALDNDENYVIKGGPNTNFEALINDMDTWNILTFKYESTLGYINYLKSAKEVAQRLELKVTDKIDAN